MTVFFLGIKVTLMIEVLWDIKLCGLINSYFISLEMLHYEPGGNINLLRCIKFLELENVSRTVIETQILQVSSFFSESLTSRILTSGFEKKN
jgi:hypothetical protein